MNQAPFQTLQVVKNSWILPIVHSLLGNKAKLVDAGLILFFPRIGPSIMALRWRGTIFWQEGNIK
jgi:hypothetical protein